MCEFYPINEYNYTLSDGGCWEFARKIWINSSKVYTIYENGKIDGLDMVTIDMGIDGFTINTTFSDALDLMGKLR